jgi:two-component system response regulator HydG
LRTEVRAGRFREDLFFRLLVIDVHLPPLRERHGDVPLLSQHFLDLFCERHGKDVNGFSARAMAALERYAWPGNVRELENVMQRVVVLAGDSQRVTTAQLPDFLRTGEEDRELERRVLAEAMHKCQGNQAAAAKLLGVPRQTLWSRLQRLESAGAPSPRRG